MGHERHDEEAPEAHRPEQTQVVGAMRRAGEHGVDIGIHDRRRSGLRDEWSAERIAVAGDQCPGRACARGRPSSGREYTMGNRHHDPSG